MGLDREKIADELMNVEEILNRVESLVSSHMNAQPWSCDCTCGETLKVVSKVDDDMDLFIVVEPCKRCCS